MPSHRRDGAPRPRNIIDRIFDMRMGTVRWVVAVIGLAVVAAVVAVGIVIAATRPMSTDAPTGTVGTVGTAPTVYRVTVTIPVASMR